MDHPRSRKGRWNPPDLPERLGVWKQAGPGMLGPPLRSEHGEPEGRAGEGQPHRTTPSKARWGEDDRGAHPPALGTGGPQMPRRGFAVTHDIVLFEY